ncbi:hypothetical protein TcasGA2_TC010708 [Tribolium castaneum]|uniref:Uncharacterized protein n=1 Tax=Tribolium castaneum TaxID=7070 RepID=D2CG42_TRICA|nr:hypothetical protein TcasGA2_TC010708 [Tribolium castaneum]
MVLIPCQLNTRKLYVKSGIAQYPMFHDAPSASTRRQNGRPFCKSLVFVILFLDYPSVPDTSLSLDNSYVSGDPTTSWSIVAAAAATVLV